MVSARPRRALAGPVVAVGMAGVPAPAPVVSPAAATAVSVRVEGNRLVNGNGAPIRLLGVDRSGTEYACVQGWGIFDGPSDAASIAAMASWHINAVRVPPNRDCWLGINGVNPATAAPTTAPPSKTTYRSPTPPG